MDEYRNQNSDEPGGSNQTHSSESSYNSETPAPNQPGQAQSDQPFGGQQLNDSENSRQQWQNEPQNSQQYWQNGPQNQQYWQNNGPQNQQQWQNGPQNNQHYWQNGSPDNQQQWQNGPRNSQQYWQNGPQNNQQYWPNGEPNNQQYWQNGQIPKKRNNLALASMIVGIFALITCCIPFIQFPLAVTAIVLVILSKKKQPFSGFAIAGLAMGILAILLSIVMLLYWGAYLQMMNDPEFSKLLNEMMELYQ